MCKELNPKVKDYEFEAFNLAQDSLRDKRIAIGDVDKIIDDMKEAFYCLESTMGDPSGYINLLCLVKTRIHKKVGG